MTNKKIFDKIIWNKIKLFYDNSVKTLNNTKNIYTTTTTTSNKLFITQTLIMQNRIILLIICLVAGQISVLAQDKYFPVSDLVQMFDTYLPTRQVEKTTESKTEAVIPSTNSLSLENQNLVRVYPTQVYSFAKVEFEIPNAGDAIIGVYDINDKKVKSIAFNHFEAGIYKKTIQTKNLAKGVYFVKLQMEGYTEIKRLTIVR